MTRSMSGNSARTARDRRSAGRVVVIESVTHFLVAAVFLAVAGLISLLPPRSVVQDVFGWVWPPALLILVVWMIIRARRQLRSRGARCS